MNSSVSNEKFDQWYEANIVTRFQTISKPNNKLDASRNYDFLGLPQSGWTHFVGHSGGGGGTSALYDPSTRTLLLCHEYDTAGEVELLESPPPPYPIRHAKLTRVHLPGGVKIGAAKTWTYSGKAFTSGSRFLQDVYGKDAGQGLSRDGLPRFMGDSIGMNPEKMAYLVEGQAANGELKRLRFIEISDRIVYISTMRGF